ncbi:MULTISPECIES: tetratricopeptide repeat protein [Chryseobacterium]|uniref:tetratricopeptide repeat protein n=1 Tax=Chryseobacterium TaxID=59732 RepID=UPI00129582A3|nr:MULTISPECIES: tetratricopeptide repeat protein [Chryseobacterium]MDR6923730.1 tetratricopeptide (TPR) repeat protein [Chryseobacterium sp. 2987]
MCKVYLLAVKLISLFVLLVILLCSCTSSVEKGNDYLYKFNDESFAMINQPEKINALKKRELEKYKKTGDRLYLISSEYCGLFTHHDKFPDTEQVFLIYKILNLNNDQYDYITITCNFNLAYQFLNISPAQSMEFLDRAIEIDEKIGKMYLLPDMYHLKGKLYYDRKDYNKALLYYNKAMECYIKRRKKGYILYIASMYSNLGTVYEKQKNIDLAIENAQKAISILNEKKKLTSEEQYYLQYFKGPLAIYLTEKKDYEQAEKLLLTALEHYKKIDFYDDSISAIQKLIDIYKKSGEKGKYASIINSLIEIEPKANTLPFKITANKMLQDYYSEINDLQNLKLVSKNLTALEHQHDTDSKEKLQKVSDSLYNYVLQKIDEEYDRKMAENKKRNWALLALALFTVLFLIWLITYTKKKNKREKELLEHQKLILEENKRLLEKDVQLHKEKNKNLNLNLNLKIETEKALLENLKKIRKTKKTDVEQNLKELQFKINNLIQIDKKNYDFINESSLENKLFTEKLSHQFPSLTEQELKLCVYFKLNLSSKEVSLLEGITSGSVRVYKTKIKSKMGLEREEGLNEFLNTI